MNKYFTLLFCFFSTIIFSQSLSPDMRLLDIYENDYLEKLQNEHPFMLQRLNYMLDHSFLIQELPEDKGFETMAKVVIKDINNFNVLQIIEDQQLKRNFDSRSIYHIEGSNKVLVFYSERELTEKLNKLSQRN